MEVETEKEILYLIEIFYTRGLIGYKEEKVAKVWNDTKGCKQNVILYTWSDYGEGGIGKIDTLPLNPEIQEKIKAYELESLEYAVNKQYTVMVEKAEAFNAKKPYQSKGQKVVVTGGRKYKGFTGVVFWEGFNKFESNYKSPQTFMQSTILGIIGDTDIKGSQFTRVGIKNESGEIAWVATENIEVVEGFVPVVISKDEVRKNVINKRENWDSLFRA
jgi:hypothetical protein